MTHPSTQELALYAGGDLGWLRRRMVERHVCSCSACQTAASEFSELRAAAAEEAPALSWSRLESEMKANIRLGLAAGECVQPRVTRGFVSGKRLALAGTALAVIGAAGVLYQWPFHNHFPGRELAARFSSGAVLEASDSGIQVREGMQTLRILTRETHRVSYTVGARGELRASSIDPETGNVTITHVYGE